LCGSLFILSKGGDLIRKLFRLLFCRMTVLITAFLLQILIFLLILLRFSHLFFYGYLLLLLLSGIAVIHILSRDALLPEIKLAWIIPILLFPLFGGILYLISDMGMVSRRFHQKLTATSERAKLLLSVPSAKSWPEDIAPQIHYFEKAAHFPCHNHTVSEYLSPGEAFFMRLLDELEKAQHTIFLEFFIIDQGIMWDRILEILQKKAALGVDVRVIYDDVGCLKPLPYRYDRQLEKYGIRCRVFSPFHPVLSRALNCRDHRKLAIIDGHIAFTGGINLADEYINVRQRHGHWKDAGIVLHGEAVWNFTVLFLTMWDYLSSENEDFCKYRPHAYHAAPFKGEGFHIPFGSDPSHPTAADSYLRVIHQTENYLYLYTPYLIADNSIITALCLAAKSGVDVRIITPGIADKWYVHLMTQSYYPRLIESGVRIYEYVPGFVHAKCLVSDDRIGIVGSINLDYRSLYLQFESAVWMAETETVLQIKQDFLETQSVCHQITAQNCENIPWYLRLIRMILRIFSPLL